MSLTMFMDDGSLLGEESSMTDNERLDQIRQVEEEIEELNAMIRIGTFSRVACVVRILAREQTALADLRRGMTKQD